MFLVPVVIIQWRGVVESGDVEAIYGNVTLVPSTHQQFPNARGPEMLTLPTRHTSAYNTHVPGPKMPTLMITVFTDIVFVTD